MHSLVHSRKMPQPLVIGLLLFLAALFYNTILVSATASFDCQTVWTGPSESNDLLACIASGESAQKQWPQFIFPGVIILTFVFLILLLPCICCCCCTNCCCKKEKTHLNYCKSILIAGFAFAGALCAIIFLITGGISFQVNYLGVMNGIVNGPIEALDIRKAYVETYLIDYSNNPPTLPDLDFDSFTTIQNDVESKINDLKDSLPMEYVVISSAVLGSILLLLSILALVAALCRCTNCACYCGWLFYVIAVIMCLIAVSMGIAAYVVSGLCGETLLQEARLPGMFQWYFLPLLEGSVDFEGLQQNVEIEVQKASMEACSELLLYCDPDEQNTASTKPFVCGNGLSSPSQCLTPNDLLGAAEGSFLKVSLASTECPEAYLNDEPCRIRMCAEDCVDPTLRSIAAEVASKFDYAENASTSLSYVMPLLEPNFVLDEITSVLISTATSPLATYQHGASNRCADIRLSVIIVEVGFYVAAIMLLLQLYVLIKTRDGEREQGVPNGEAHGNPLDVNVKDTSFGVNSTPDVSKSVTQDFPVVSEDHVKNFDEPASPLDT